MAHKGTRYALRLNKDKTTREHIALMRIAGLSSKKIGELTGRHSRTIDEEFTRPEHKKMVLRFVSSIAKKRLPKEKWQVVERELTEKEA